MIDKLLSIDQILELLEATPVLIESHSSGLTPGRLLLRPAPEEWSVNEVLAHLRSCADVWGGCITRILAEDHPTIRAINPRTWIKQTAYPGLPFEPSFRAFQEQREQLLTQLRSLGATDWSQSATITGAGRPLERSVHSYGSWLARHERPHVKQIATITLALTPEEH